MRLKSSSRHFEPGKVGKLRKTQDHTTITKPTVDTRPILVTDSVILSHTMTTNPEIDADASLTEDSQTIPDASPKFHKFSKLPTEIRLMIWGYATAGAEPRIVHIRQRRLKELEGNWWQRVRSDIEMWPCDKPFEQDKLAPWERDDWDARFECEYEDDDVLDDLEEVERLERESILKDNRKPGELEAMQDYEWHDLSLDLLIDECIQLDSEEKSILYGESYYDDNSESESNGENYDDFWIKMDNQEAVRFGAGRARPKSLWAFDTESPTPGLLLACRESRGIAVGRYKPLFSSLGSVHQIYFDPLRDSLYIDNNSFLGKYEGVDFWIERYLLPSDAAEVRNLAIEAIGLYENVDILGDPEPVFYACWLLHTVALFPNISKVMEVGGHITYAPQTKSEQREAYVNLKKLDVCQDGMDIYGRTEAHGYCHGTVYLNGLRIDRSFIDWDRLFVRSNLYACQEAQLYDQLDEWSEQHPGSNPIKIELDWGHLIPAVDEKRLLYDAAEFEEGHNNGRWMSYWDPHRDIFSKDVPAHFFE